MSDPLSDVNESAPSAKKDDDLDALGRPKLAGPVGWACMAAAAYAVYRWGRPYDRLFEIAAAAIVVSVAQLCGFLLAGLLAGIRVKRVTYPSGRPLVRVRMGGGWLTIGWLPLAGSVTFDGQENVDLDSPAPAPPGTWGHANPLVRAAAHVAGPLLVFVVASIDAGPRLVWENIVETPGQFYDVFTAGRLPSLLSGFYQFVDNAPFSATLGVVAGKCIFSNLLPVPFVNGGMALFEVSRYLTKRFPSRRVWTVWQVLSLLGCVAVGIYLYYTAFRVWVATP